MQAREECDDGNTFSGDGCSALCKREVTQVAGIAICGDGKLDASEECDDGIGNSNFSQARCRPDCRLNPCGNGRLDAGELCDDGNRLNADGCDEFCRSERLPVRPAALPQQAAVQPYDQAVQPAAVDRAPIIPAQVPDSLPQNAVPQMIVFGASSQTAPAASGSDGRIATLGAASWQPQQSPFAQVPLTASLQPLSYGFPFAWSAGMVTSQAPIGDTGPAALLAVAAGSAAGIGILRRRRK